MVSASEEVLFQLFPLSVSLRCGLSANTAAQGRQIEYDVARAARPRLLLDHFHDGTGASGEIRFTLPVV